MKLNQNPPKKLTEEEKRVIITPTNLITQPIEKRIYNSKMHKLVNNYLDNYVDFSYLK